MTIREVEGKAKNQLTTVTCVTCKKELLSSDSSRPAMVSVARTEAQEHQSKNPLHNIIIAIVRAFSR